MSKSPASALAKLRWANVSPEDKALHMKKMREARGPIKGNPDALRKWHAEATPEMQTARATKGRKKS